MLTAKTMKCDPQTRRRSSRQGLKGHIKSVDGAIGLNVKRLQKIKIACVCGARPNFMKIAPIMKVLAQAPGVETVLIHTGQHYDQKMSQLFFDELKIPKPDVNLEVGSCSHAVQTARVMERFEQACLENHPEWVIVVGDVNSTLACALVAVKLGIKVAHVESGLRSFDRTMPEEINRIMTDSISDLLLVSEPSGVENLRREGITGNHVQLVGNVMIDTLLTHRNSAERSDVLRTYGLARKGYGVMTLHRPSNVDDAEVLSSILQAVEVISKELPIICPIHPRSKTNLERLALAERVAQIQGLRLIDPLGYLDFLKLMSDAAVVLTDSGGIQEETTILQVPCLTLRDNTERPITIEEGTNHLVGTNAETILAAYREVRICPTSLSKMPALWDGHAAERIVDCLLTASVVRKHIVMREPRKNANRVRVRKLAG